MKQSTFRTILSDPKEKIHNGQIIHYTRRDPQTGEIAPTINWMRSICTFHWFGEVWFDLRYLEEFVDWYLGPWDTTLSTNVWQQIERPTWTNEELLAEVRQIPQLVNNKPGKYVLSPDHFEQETEEKQEEQQAVDPEFVWVEIRT